MRGGNVTFAFHGTAVEPGKFLVVLINASEQAAATLLPKSVPLLTLAACAEIEPEPKETATAACMGDGERCAVDNAGHRDGLAFVPL